MGREISVTVNGTTHTSEVEKYNEKSEVTILLT